MVPANARGQRLPPVTGFARMEEHNMVMLARDMLANCTMEDSGRASLRRGQPRDPSEGPRRLVAQGLQWLSRSAVGVRGRKRGRRDVQFNAARAGPERLSGVLGHIQEV